MCIELVEHARDAFIGKISEEARHEHGDHFSVGDERRISFIRKLAHRREPQRCDSHRVCGRLDAVAQAMAVQRGGRTMRRELELGHHTEGAGACAAARPQEVGRLSAGVGDALRVDDSHAQQVVACEAELAREKTVASAEGKPGDSDPAARSCREQAPARKQVIVDPGKGRAGLRRQKVA
jgi:hypothetical protein